MVGTMVVSENLKSVVKSLPDPVQSALKRTVKKLPYPVLSALISNAERPGQTRRAIKLTWDKYRILWAGHTGKSVRLLDYDVRIGGGRTPFDLYEDIFINHVYDFHPQRVDPRILDCGSNVGMSVLYFKHRYPQARIVGFEPDPTNMTLLRENLERNGLTDVEIVNAALAAQPGTMTLHSCAAGSHLDGYTPEDWADGTIDEDFEVPCVRLSEYLNEPVDFMKMNIEGAEYEVLSECEPHLGQIREMSIEYHRLPGVPCTLHKILDLLHRNGFVYVVSDFGLAMYGTAQPPVRLDPHALFHRQIYASRVSDVVPAN